MDVLDQQGATKAMRVLACAVSVPASVLIGLLLKGAVSPDVDVTGALVGWMSIFVLSIVLPVHFIALPVVYLLARNRFVFRWPLTPILALCSMGIVAIAMSGSGNPFSVFSLTTAPLFLLAYVVAAGRTE